MATWQDRPFRLDKALGPCNPNKLHRRTLNPSARFCIRPETSSRPSLVLDLDREPRRLATQAERALQNVLVHMLSMCVCLLEHDPYLPSMMMLSVDMSVSILLLWPTATTRYYFDPIQQMPGASSTYVPSLQATSHRCIGAVTPLNALLRAELCDDTLDMPCPCHVVPGR